MDPRAYADEHMRTMIMSSTQPSAQPFAADQDGPHKEIRLTPAHVSCALLVQAMVRQQSAGTPAASENLAGLGGQSALTNVMAEYVKAQQAVLEKDKKKGTLPYSLAERLKELGLASLPEEAKPSEEALLRLETLAKVARSEGRKWVGSAEGEDLQQNFRPSWTRTPSLEAFVGDASLDQKVREAQATKKVRSLHDKVEYMSYANFTSHLLDWGLKMIITKTLTPIDLLSYQSILCRISEEYGGVRSAYYYDLLQRQKLAKTLQNTPDIEVTAFLNKVDHDTLKDSQAKFDAKAKELGRDNVRWQAGAGRGGGADKGSKAWAAKDNRGASSPSSSNAHLGNQPRFVVSLVNLILYLFQS